MSWVPMIASRYQSMVVIDATVVDLVVIDAMVVDLVVIDVTVIDTVVIDATVIDTANYYIAVLPAVDNTRFVTAYNNVANNTDTNSIYYVIVGNKIHIGHIRM